MTCCTASNDTAQTDCSEKVANCCRHLLQEHTSDFSSSKDASKLAISPLARMSFCCATCSQCCVNCGQINILPGGDHEWASLLSASCGPPILHLQQVHRSLACRLKHSLELQCSNPMACNSNVLQLANIRPARIGHFAALQQGSVICKTARIDFHWAQTDKHYSRKREMNIVEEAVACASTLCCKVSASSPQACAGCGGGPCPAHSAQLSDQHMFHVKPHAAPSWLASHPSGRRHWFLPQPAEQ